MIIVTGGAGFIGSTIVWKLNKRGIHDIVVVDEADTAEVNHYLSFLRFSGYEEKGAFLLHGSAVEKEARRPTGLRTMNAPRNRVAGVGFIVYSYITK